MARPDALWASIVEKVAQGIPLEGTYYPKTNNIRWRLGSQSVRALAVNRAIKEGWLEVESMAFPFTNGRRGKLRQRPPVVKQERAA
jgi:hypothetical protein